MKQVLILVPGPCAVTGESDLRVKGGRAVRVHPALGSSGPNTGPGPIISLIAAGTTAYLLSLLLSLLLGLVAGALLVLLPQLMPDPPIGIAEGALPVMQVVVLVAVVWLGMRRERLQGGIASLAVASLYGGIGIGMALIYLAGGPLAGMVALVVMAGWSWIYGSHGTPWYDPDLVAGGR